MLIVIYTSVFGFVLIHVLKTIKQAEEANARIKDENAALEEKMKAFDFRLSLLDSQLRANVSSKEMMFPGNMKTQESKKAKSLDKIRRGHTRKRTRVLRAGKTVYK